MSPASSRRVRPAPVIDNVPEGALTAHAVRRLRPCAHCAGIGDHQQMILSAAGQHYHTGCYVASVGFAAVLRLSRAERGKFRLCDLSVRQARKLLEAPP